MKSQVRHTVGCNFWWGCRVNLTLITLGSEPVAVVTRSSGFVESTGPASSFSIRWQTIWLPWRWASCHSRPRCRYTYWRRRRAGCRNPPRRRRRTGPWRPGRRSTGCRTPAGSLIRRWCTTGAQSRSGTWRFACRTGRPRDASCASSRKPPGCPAPWPLLAWQDWKSVTQHPRSQKQQ